MAVRRNTKNRLSLYRTCHVCGKSFLTTADTPFVRQLYNVDGKKQKTCYFCSLSCKNSTYKHRFDGLAWQRREQYEASRDVTEKNRRYYEAHREQELERSRQAYRNMSDQERAARSSYRRMEAAVLRAELNERCRMMLEGS